MNPKILDYDIDIRSTSPIEYPVRHRLYTNDLNVAEFQIKITDIPPLELEGSSAMVLLYMRDSSFFVSSEGEVRRIEDTFHYTLKENEGNHAGIAQIQLVVTMSNAARFASQPLDFEIINGLETRVGPEVVIGSWENLAKELRSDIAQLVGTFEASLTPFDFGAHGNGLQDDTDAFLALFAHCKAQNILTVRLAPGRYRVSSLTIPEWLTVRVDIGASFVINNNCVLTIDAWIDAEAVQIFEWDRCLTVIDGGIAAIDFASWGHVEGSMRAEWCCPQWWGAVADGTGDGFTGTDNYFAIKALSLYVSQTNRAKVYFPKGIYFVNQYKLNSLVGVDMTWENLDHLTLSGYGVSIDIFNNIAKTIDDVYGNLSIFQLKNINSLLFEGFEIDHNGDMAYLEDGVDRVALGRSSIEFWNVSNVRMLDISTFRSFAAGIAIWEQCEDFVFENVSSTGHNWGSIIVSGLVNGLFRKSNFNYSGVGNLNGIAQNVGILIEAHTEAVENILFDNCTVKGNKGAQLMIAHTPYVGTVRFFGGFVQTEEYSVQGCFLSKATNFIADGVMFDLSKGGWIKPRGYYDDEYDGKSTYVNCTIVTKERGIEHNSNTGLCIIERCKLIVLSEGSTGTVVPYIQSGTTEFANNHIFYPKEMMNLAVGVTAMQVAILQNLTRCENNVFETDWDGDAAGYPTKHMYISTDGAALVHNLSFKSPNGKGIRPWSNSQWDNRIRYSERNAENALYGRVLSMRYGNDALSTRYGTSAPTSGTWKRGELINNVSPSELGSAGSKYVVVGWVCVASGTPGVWVQRRELTGN